MPLLAHPLEEAARRAGGHVRAIRLLADAVIAIRAWKVAYGVHQARAYAAEYALTQATVAFVALWEVHAAAARRAAHRDSVGSIYQVALYGDPSLPGASAGVASLADPPAFLAPAREELARRLLMTLRAASAKAADPNGTPAAARHSPDFTMSAPTTPYTSSHESTEHIVAQVQLLAEALEMDFFTGPLSNPNPPPGSRAHPTVRVLLDAAGQPALQASDWSTLIAALRSATTQIKVANPTLINYLGFFAHNPQPPRRVIPVDFQGLPDFLQLPHPHAAIIDFWWNHNRFPALQPFSVVAGALAEYLRGDPLARDLWNKFCMSSDHVNYQGGAHLAQAALPWLSEDLGHLDGTQQLTPADLAQVLPVDSLYDTSIGDWIVWRLLGWLYLALETENHLYAMRKQLPLMEHARPIAVVQAAMNQLRAKYGYTREVHARLAQLSLKMLHRPYPLFASRFHQVITFLNTLHAQIADILAKPYLQDADAVAWRRVYDSILRAVRQWAMAHSISLPMEVQAALASADRVGGSPAPPTDLGPLLARVSESARFLAGRFFINPLTVQRTIHGATGLAGYRWLQQPVDTTAFSPATSLALDPALIDTAARAMSAGSHPHVQLIYGITVLQGHWSFVTEAGESLGGDDDDVPSPNAARIPGGVDLLCGVADDDRLVLSRGLFSALWMLASAGIPVQCWPRGGGTRSLRLVAVQGVPKLPLADIIAHSANMGDRRATTVTAAAAVADVPGVAQFLRALLLPAPVLAPLAAELDRLARDPTNCARPELFFQAASQTLTAFQMPVPRIASSMSSRSAHGTAVAALTPHVGNGAPPTPPARTPSPIRAAAAMGITGRSGSISSTTPGFGSTAAAAASASYTSVMPGPSGLNGKLSHQRRASLTSLASVIRTAASSLDPHAPVPDLSPEAVAETWERALSFYRQGQGDISAAFALFAQVAHAVPAALFYMAEALYYGSKTSNLRQDTHQAAAYYARALENGVSIAHVGLGDCAYFGFGGSRDVAAAAEHYRAALAEPLASLAALESIDPADHPLVTPRTRARAAAGLGDCHFDAEEYAAARDAYLDAVRLDPGPGGALPCSPEIDDCASRGTDGDDPSVLAAMAAAAAATGGSGGLTPPGCRKAHARLAELHILGQGGAAADLDAAREYLKRARGCRREVLAKCAWFVASGQPTQADEYRDEYLWRYPLDY
ncbi:hypothetical protein AMAG_11918 [Allomyces macrogynus ATCC 38327]|uniref:Uncharacterized protein n=1 Tax=Allomyces macrogynus (strain ATCC 38327) TaxID=578462 RepID=A0A0L0SY92_ALLM3|nr:hypothetical protein AMAG_11918 [Allomyces macrogynus ATCC 38327]|eukprot:KNE67456.1 hypothetical protein AMAG_11918 [Allomyces macrogynus ATCC 38327]